MGPYTLAMYTKHRKGLVIMKLTTLHKHDCIQQTSTPIEMEHVLKVTIAIII